MLFTGWPGDLGGANTKLAHLCDLLCGVLPITIVTDDFQQLRQKKWTRFLESRGVGSVHFDDLNSHLDGIVLSMANPKFFSHGYAEKFKDKGLKTIWSGVRDYVAGSACSGMNGTANGIAVRLYPPIDHGNKMEGKKRNECLP